MEVLIWVAFCFGIFWGIGFPYFMILGIILDGYHCIRDIDSFFEVASGKWPYLTWEAFAEYPFRRHIVWTLTYIMGMGYIWVPGFNVVVMPGLGFIAWLSETQ